MSGDNELLLPEASPTELRKGIGVRRVNNLPIYLVGAAVLGFLLVMGLVAIDRSKQPQSAAESAKDKQGDALQFAEAIAGNRTGGVVPAELPPLPPAIPIALPDDMDMPPLPPRLQQDNLKPANAANPDLERISQQKMQLFESAVKSKTSVSLPERMLQRTLNNNSSVQGALMLDQGNNSGTNSGLNASFQSKLAELQTGKSDFNTPLNKKNDIKQFAATDKGNRWQLDSQMEAAPTPYTLRAGFVIPATLISGVNSDLPGQIIGQVSQNVYDTGTGQHLLIPQGARLVGIYASDVAYGQSRVLIAWQRIVFPDGRAMDIGAMPGADGIGKAGFTDQVNNHYLRIFGSALLMSGISAGVAISQDHDSNVFSQPSTGSMLSEALGQQLGNTTAQMISKNLSISPTLEIRPGFRFNVMCIKDLVFNQPYALFDN